MEPDCNDCLDTGETFVVTNEATGAGLWHPCPCRWESEYALATAGIEDEDDE